MINLKSLSLAEAKQIAAAAVNTAHANGWNVVIAILDVTGQLQYLERADGTQLGSVAVAQEKARTALLFKRPSKALEDVVAAGKIHMMALPGATPIEGGLPLLHNDQLVGAIGVSGVQSAQDGAIAKAGAELCASLPG